MLTLWSRWWDFAVFHGAFSSVWWSKEPKLRLVLSGVDVFRLDRRHAELSIFLWILTLESIMGERRVKVHLPMIAMSWQELPIVLAMHF